MRLSDCSFCNICDSSLLLSNDHAIALYDGFPVTKGHALIITRRHVASFFDVSKEERMALFDLLTEVRELLVHTFSPEGFNIGINDGVTAGQTVLHLHVHLIPRYAGDTADPRGGVRWIMPEQAPYWKRTKGAAE